MSLGSITKLEDALGQLHPDLVEAFLKCTAYTDGNGQFLYIAHTPGNKSIICLGHNIPDLAASLAALALERQDIAELLSMTIEILANASTDSE